MLSLAGAFILARSSGLCMGMHMGRSAEIAELEVRPSKDGPIAIATLCVEERELRRFFNQCVLLATVFMRV
jgi:hypothetical protein